MSQQHGWRWMTSGAAALGLVWASPTVGVGAPRPQTPGQTPPPADHGTPNDPGEDEGPPPRPPQDAPDIWPTAEPRQSGGPGADVGQRPTPGRLVREGSFLDARRGRMAAVRSGGWLYVFDADARGEAEPPMVLLPCLRLMEMERLVSAKQETVTFQISGQVTAYQGRNYLLVTYFTTLASDALRPAAAAAPALPAAASAPKSKDPSVRELIERARPDDRRTDRATDAGVPNGGSAPGAPGEASVEGGRMLREGLTIASRRGRIQRGVGGAWVFMPDNGAAAPDGADPAMILQPCLNLERLERLIGDRGDRITLSVSGQVFAYQSRNYLLPTVYRVEPDREGNLGPGQ